MCMGGIGCQYLEWFSRNLSSKIFLIPVAVRGNCLQSGKLVVLGLILGQCTASQDAIRASTNNLLTGCH